MKLRYIFLFILMALTGVLFFTNPDEQAHKNFLKDKFTELFNQKAEEEINKITETDPNLKFIRNISKNLLPVLGNQWINKLIDMHTQRKNYFLFSTIQVQYKDEWHTIGIGILNKMYLFPGVEEKIQKLDVKSEILKLSAES